MTTKALKVKGVCKWWNDSKGYGFISYGTHDVFVHYSQISAPQFQTMCADQIVEFDLIEGPKGYSAANVLKGRVLERDKYSPIDCGCLSYESCTCEHLKGN